MGVSVKICGITRRDDVLTAAQAGVNFAGVIVEIEESPRAVSVETARCIIADSPIPIVLLMEKSSHEIEQIAGELKPFAVQLVGDVPAETICSLKKHNAYRIWKTMQVAQQGEDFSLLAAYTLLEQYRTSGVDTIVLDTLVREAGKQKKGGTGQVCDWHMAKKLAAQSSIPVFLAGGISPANVREAMREVHPYGIDVSSGVECEPGKKDPQKILKLMHIIRSE
ncbi:MAG: phosphoribosylanthranilate isomerase [Proteobacteria bacterium]|nr:phosphoribosylanthranilate isomerase [Pseudomonadota bacterium]